MAKEPDQLKRGGTGRLAWLLPLVATGVVLAGCIPTDFGAPPPPPAPKAPLPAAAKPAPVVTTLPVPSSEPAAPGTVEPTPPPTPVRPPAPVSPASQALITQSRGHQAAGRYEQAAASIERALRIEPRQPLLWLELGDIRLKEGDYAQAESIGRKALSLSSGDAALTARAEQLITAARKR